MKIKIQGETMLERSVSFWRSLGVPIIAASGYPGHFEGLPEGVKEAYDVYPGRGPLGGLHAGLLSAETDLVFFCAGDMPLLSEKHVLKLLESVGGHDACVYSNEGRPEPLFGIYRKTCLAIADEMLRGDNVRMAELLSRADTVMIPAEDTSVFTNLNTPEELRKMRKTPVITFVGLSGTGKTTFIEKLIPELKARGLKLSVIKHDVHGFEIDKEGKDTWRFSHAGADTVAIASENNLAVMEHSAGGYTLESIISRMPECDLIITEGYKKNHYKKIEIHRSVLNKPLICSESQLLCVITDEPLPVSVPQLDLDDVKGCADIITGFIKTGDEP